MSVFSHVDGLGDRIEEAISDSLLTWGREFSNRQEATNLIAELLTSVTTDFTIFPGGYCTVAVTVRARKRHDDAHYLFRFNRVKGGVWERSGSSIRS